MIVNMKKLIPIFVGMSLLTLTGCGCKQPACNQAVVTDDVIGSEESLDTVAYGIGEGRTTDGMLPVYYSFDSSDIRDDQKARVEVNADFMAAASDLGVRIEGNTDSRGTNEYNMALGERRALSAKKALIDLGVAEARLSTVSYGEERLLLSGKNGSSAQNRRSDFVVAQ